MLPPRHEVAEKGQISRDLGSASNTPSWCHCCQPSSTSPSVAGAWRFSMPLDGTVPWSQPLRWIIRVRLAPHLLAESRHWSQRKLRVFHRLAADAVYAAIDAIQRWDLHTRREEIPRRGSWVCYLFQLERETRTIRITISKFHFHDPAPPTGPGGGGQGLPQGELIVHVFGSGREYTIALVKGFLPVPPRPAQNSIIPLIEQIGAIRTKFAFMRGMPQKGSLPISPIEKAMNRAIRYSPRSLKTRDRTNPGDAAWFYEPSTLEPAPPTPWSAKWLQMLNVFGSYSVDRQKHYSNGHALKSVTAKHIPADRADAIGDAEKSILSRMIFRARSPLHDQPLRPGGM